ncbi:hypothetical protein Q7P37_001473 [Cladosporium fusiforme]
MSIPLTQKAIVQGSAYSTSLTLVTDHPVPTPKPFSTEHLVRVHTTAITSGELLWPRYFPVETAEPKILVPCADVAGTVVTAPADSPFQPGSEVYARSNYRRSGCAREYTILLTEEMALRPQNLLWAESAAVPMSAQTAWQALFDHAGIEAIADEGAKDKLVFVTGAAGGAGVWMVQLAKWAGAEVVALCGPGKAEWVQQLGADLVLDYSQVDVAQWVVDTQSHCDIVIDCVGGKTLENCWKVVQGAGILISIVQPPGDVKPADIEGQKENVRDLFFVMEPDGEQLRRVTEMIESGKGRPSLDSAYRFDRFQEAFDKVASRKTRGKVVLELLAE